MTDLQLTRTFAVITAPDGEIDDSATHVSAPA